MWIKDFLFDPGSQYLTIMILSLKYYPFLKIFIIIFSLGKYIFFYTKKKHQPQKLNVESNLPAIA